MGKKDSYTYFKLNRDDILSIVKDQLAHEVDFKDGHSAQLDFIEDEEGLRVVAVFGELECDVNHIDLNEVDKKISYNGHFSTLSKEADLRQLSKEEVEAIIKRSSRPIWMQKIGGFFKDRKR